MQHNVEQLKVAVFASGRGSNFQAILENINKGTLNAKIVCVVSNRSNSGALETARTFKIPDYFITDKQFETETDYEEKLLALLKKHNTQLIVLAGYMKKIPSSLIHEYKHRILNIHPALLPSFGGKGMYGHFVHKAVLSYGCKISGATVHLVDEDYDTGAPIIQETVPVLEDDTPDILAQRVLQIEHKIYSKAIQLFAENRIQIKGRNVTILKESIKV